ncbi:MAG: zinc metalloprotease HtpX [Thermoplasmata archaeon]|nr:zinc metalloprotease HtpX [Thermoplasmata archaeon]
MEMGLKTRMAIALALLFGLVFAVGMGFIAVLEYFGLIQGIWLLIIPLCFAIFVVFLQWAISPFILSWIYKIEWVSLEALPPAIATYITDVCAKERINLPRVGIIDDLNPNAFTFGWTKNHARVAITRGVLEYCDTDEAKAVIAHEMGHIVHDDFVLMTIVSAIPLIFYIIARVSIQVLRYMPKGKKSGGQAALVFLITAAFSYLIYILSQFVALLISRYREYYADEYAAESTRKPNALASALLKIAYGMATQGLGEASEKGHLKHVSSLGIFNADSARALAAMSADAYGNYSVETIQKAMAWDLWNPWAWWLEIQSTHPLPAKRLKKLGEIAEKMGQKPLVQFKLKKPECYWDDFLKDIFAKYGGLILGFVTGILLMWYGWTHGFTEQKFAWTFLFSCAFFMVVTGAWGLVYLLGYAYPFRFKDSEVVTLLENPKASPIKGIPVRLQGRIIGRGIPGLFYSEDLKIDDGTGLLLIDYHQISKLIDFFVGIFGTEKHVGKTVVVEGWYRRRIIPYLELYRMYPLDGGESRKIYTSYLYIAFAAVVTGLGLLFSFLLLPLVL